MATALSQVPRRLRRKLPRSVGPFYGSAGALDGAVAAWRAKDYAGSGALRDISGLGAAHDLTNNGATFLPFDGEKYVYLPGLVNNSVQLSGAAPSTSNLDVRVEVTSPTWTANGFRVSDWVSTGNNRCWWFGLTGGKPTVTLDPLGDFTAQVTSTCSTAVPFANGATGWVRFVHTPGSSLVTFYTSTDGSLWTQLGSPVAGLSVAPKTTTTASSLVLGGLEGGGSGSVEAMFHNARVYSGTTLTASWSAEDMGQTGGDSGGRTWTINRATSGRKAVLVDRPLFLLGTDDYLTTADHDDLNVGASDPLTVVMALRSHTGGVGSFLALLAKKAELSTSAGYALYQNNSALALGVVVADGTVSRFPSGTPALASGAAASIALVRDVDVDTITGYVNGVAGTPGADTTTATWANALPLEIGRISSAANYSTFEFLGAAIFRRALSNIEIASVGVALGAAA